MKRTKEPKEPKKARDKRKPTMFEAVFGVLILAVVFFFGALVDANAPTLVAIAMSYVGMEMWI